MWSEFYLNLQLVLVVCMAVCQVPELLCLVETPLQVFRGYKVLSHFDTVVDISHLNIYPQFSGQ